MKNYLLILSVLLGACRKDDPSAIKNYSGTYTGIYKISYKNAPSYNPTKYTDSTLFKIEFKNGFYKAYNLGSRCSSILCNGIYEVTKEGITFIDSCSSINILPEASRYDGVDPPYKLFFHLENIDLDTIYMTNTFNTFDSTGRNINNQFKEIYSLKK